MAELKTKKCKHCNGTGKEFDHRLVGNLMRRLREKSNITQAHVADSLKISKPYLCDLEHGFRNWRTDLIVKYRKSIRK